MKDACIQDSTRQLGAIPDLVAMLASDDDTCADVAKLALLALRHRNGVNQLEVVRAVRMSCELNRDGCKLARAAELLSHDCGDPCSPCHPCHPCDSCSPRDR